MSGITIPKRVFRFGATELQDPSEDGSMPAEEVKQHYTANYPHLATATISEPALENGVLVYRFEAPPAKTKG